MSAAPLIDRVILDELIDSIGAAGARSVIELFIEESRSCLATINAAVAPAADASDAAAGERARRAAHSLKSAAGQIGAAALSLAAAAVEGAFEGERTRPPAAFAPSIADLNTCAEQTDAALAATLDLA